jgi:hypothetical protein
MKMKKSPGFMNIVIDSVMNVRIDISWSYEHSQS